MYELQTIEKNGWKEKESKKLINVLRRCISVNFFIFISPLIVACGRVSHCVCESVCA